MVKVNIDEHERELHVSTPYEFLFLRNCCYNLSEGNIGQDLKDYLGKFVQTHSTI